MKKLFIKILLFCVTNLSAQIILPSYQALNHKVEVAQLNTSSATSITGATAISGGNIISSLQTVTSRGVVWSTSPNPTIALSTKTADGSGLGSFTSSISGLDSSTTYYVRSYATTNGGTSYGTQITFTTSLVLTTVTIGTQIWTNKNLDVTTYRNGDVITFASNDTEWNTANNAGIGAWCYYGFNSSNGPTYGKLYNWYAVNDSRGLAPLGYHVPTRTEFNTLATNSAASLKTNTADWGAYTGTNTTNFNGRPGGSKKSGSGSTDMGTSGFFWTVNQSSTNPTTEAYFRLLHATAGFVELVFSKKVGMSVRLLKD